MSIRKGHGMTFPWILLLAYLICGEIRMQFGWSWIGLARLLICYSFRTTDSASDLAPIRMREIVRLHGIPKTTTFDRDAKFLLKFWERLHYAALGMQLRLLTTFHPKTDG
jgi:hypothetical protein